MVSPQVDTGLFINLPFWTPEGLERMKQLTSKQLFCNKSPISGKKCTFMKMVFSSYCFCFLYLWIKIEFLHISPRNINISRQRNVASVLNRFMELIFKMSSRRKKLLQIEKRFRYRFRKWVSLQQAWRITKLVFYLCFWVCYEYILLDEFASPCSEKVKLCHV